MNRVSTRLMGLRCARGVLGSAVVLGTTGLVTTPVMAKHHDGIHVDIDIHAGPRVERVPVERVPGPIVVPAPVPPPVYPAPAYEDREVRVWVEPVYQTVTDRQWVPAEYRTVVERVWVPDAFEERTIVRGHRRYRERVLIEPGHYADVSRQELVCDGHWQDVPRQELVTPGHWETHIERVPVEPGYRR